MNGQNRADVKIGASVRIVLKADQRTGNLTSGVVARILTNSSFHPHGIKVMLTDGQVGRVQEIL
ncbi:MAG: YwbE family protein [Clostridiaceae bacterium]